MSVELMLDLHGKTVQEVKKELADKFTQIEKLNLGEFYIVTGRGNHVHSNGTRGVLKKILPKLLKPYTKEILLVDKDLGYYKVVLNRKNKDHIKKLQERLSLHLELAPSMIKKLEKQILQKDINAMEYIAMLHIHKAGPGYEDFKKGVTLLEKTKALGSVSAHVELGRIYYDGINCQHDYTKAFHNFEFAAAKEDPVAQYFLSICYLHGKGVKKDESKAVVWMKKSADQGDPTALYEIGKIYLAGLYGVTKDEKLGFEYLKKSADKEFAPAQGALAQCYLLGEGVPQDFTIAFGLYAQAAKPMLVDPITPNAFSKEEVEMDACLNESRTKLLQDKVFKKPDGSFTTFEDSLQMCKDFYGKGMNQEMMQVGHEQMVLRMIENQIHRDLQLKEKILRQKMQSSDKKLEEEIFRLRKVSQRAQEDFKKYKQSIKTHFQRNELLERHKLSLENEKLYSTRERGNTIKTTLNLFVKPHTKPVALGTLQSISISELKMDTVNYGKYLRGTLFVEPTKMNGVLTLLEDANKNLVRVAIYNHLLCTDHKKGFAPGKMIIIREPFYKFFRDMYPGIRVDNPEDIELIEDPLSHIKDTAKQYFFNKQYTEAVREYTEALQLKKDVSLYNNRSLCYWNMGEYEKGLCDSEEAILLDHNDYVARFRKSKCLISLNRSQEALETLQHLLLNKEIPPNRVSEIQELLNTAAAKTSIITQSKKKEAVLGEAHTNKIQENIEEDEKFNTAKAIEEKDSKQNESKVLRLLPSLNQLWVTGVAVVLATVGFYFATNR